MKLTDLLVEKVTKVDVIKFAQSRKTTKQGTVWGGLVNAWGGYSQYTPCDNDAGSDGDSGGE